ncbi:unnamed protein product [Adineta steineri]|uniref:Uncharacterized protein n=1 Tax=Adineta steineri TaxID=433720 RepID=A0A813MNV1_9BILA|nr:unnamed protein product [Adineta steineri]CAF0793569.1 unnamed protein product [Adineta steineri]
MAGYVLVRSNWTSINSISLDLVCDVDIEENNQSATMDNQEENNDDNDINLRKTASSNDNVKNIILRSNDTDKREDPVIILSVLQPDEYHIISIQFLSNAKHTEFYHREYIGSCQGSRITELENDPIYESSFEFNEIYEEITLKCLKLADTTELIVYCIQINLSKNKSNTLSTPMMHLPFDLNRVRSMVDETHLSSNARQFMNDLQHLQDHRRVKETSSSSSSPQFNLGQFVSLMSGMKSSAPNPKQTTPTPLTSILNEIKSSVNEEVKCTQSQNNDRLKQDLNELEHRLETYVDKRFLELQQHIDDRFNRLEEKLNKNG